MNNLYEVVRAQINLGYYSLYRLDDNRIILYMPETHSCCSAFPRQAHIYELSEDGTVIKELPNEIRDYKVKESIRPA